MAETRMVPPLALRALDALWLAIPTHHSTPEIQKAYADLKAHHLAECAQHEGVRCRVCQRWHDGIGPDDHETDLCEECWKKEAPTVRQCVGCGGPAPCDCDEAGE